MTQAIKVGDKQRYKLLTLLIAPAIIAGLVGFILFIATQQYNIYSHDVLESHKAIMLLPFIFAASFFLGYVPAFCYLSKLLYSIEPITEQVNEVQAMTASTAPVIHVGQIITSAGANCKLRVKQIKYIFDNADLSQYDYCLQFNF